MRFSPHSSPFFSLFLSGPSRTRISLIAGMLVIAVCAPSSHASSASVFSMLDARDEFDSHSLTDPRTGSASSLSWEHPSRFSMHQTYSLSAVSSAEGSASSGVYLNTLSYGFTPLMSVFVDVGFHTPIHSSLPGMDDAAGAGSLIIPRMGLEYRPSDRLTFNLELVNGQDAWKAWGGSPSGLSSSRPFPGSRTP